MRETQLILIAVLEPQRSALRRWAAESGLASLELRAPDELGGLGDLDPALCVLDAGEERELSPERIRSLRKSLAGSPLVVLGRRIGIGCAVELVRMGVEDVVEPTGQLSQDLSRITRHARREARGEELVGSSPAVRRLRKEIAAAAVLGSTVLLTGEQGAGKGAVARAIHRHSRWRDDPFVDAPCDELDVEKLEAELATTGKRTLLLDEVADLRASAQARLVRKLGDGSPGGRGFVRGPRIIATSSRDLREEVRTGSFRGDLYVRLNVLQIAVPPLRERASDIADLALLVVERMARQLGASLPALPDPAFEAMTRYAWPGNVRELSNVVERAVVRYQAGILDDAGLLAALDPADALAGPSTPKASSELSRAAIAGVLAATGGNVARAARRLGIPRTTLSYRIRVLGLDDHVPRD
jgi:two-component system nitrogen regulation response regulator NtrX